MAKIETNLTAAQIAIAEALFADNYAVTTGKRDGNPISRTIPMAEFPIASWRKIVAYGVQRTFNDATGGSDKTQDDKLKTIGEMIEAFKRGDVGRKPRESADPVTNAIRAIMRKLVKGQLAKEAYKALSESDEFEEKIDGLLASQPEEVQAAIRAQAEAEVEAARKRAAGLGKINLAVNL